MRSALEARGHTIHEDEEIGEVNVVRRLSGGELQAAADPRGPGAAGLTNQ